VDAASNARLRLCALSLSWHLERRHRPPLLDARLTSWNARHKRGDDGVVRVVDPDVAAPPLRRGDAGAHNRLEMLQQAAWRYYVCLDGNVGASRVGELAELSFVLLIMETAAPQVALLRLLQPWVHYVPLKPDLSDLEAHLLWLRWHDDRARALARALQERVRPRLERSYMERALAEEIQRLPPASGELPELRELWQRRRSGIYVLLSLRDGLLMFSPFCNANFRNDWQLEFEPSGLEAFLRKAARVSDVRGVLRDTHSWWDNGALLCNVPRRDIWGEAFLPEIYSLLRGCCTLLRDVDHAVQPVLREDRDAPMADDLPVGSVVVQGAEETRDPVDHLAVLLSSRQRRVHRRGEEKILLLKQRR
jgi:hypothetical protein